MTHVVANVMEWIVDILLSKTVLKENWSIAAVIHLTYCNGNKACTADYRVADKYTLHTSGSLYGGGRGFDLESYRTVGIYMTTRQREFSCRNNYAISQSVKF